MQKTSTISIVALAEVSFTSFAQKGPLYSPYSLILYAAKIQKQYPPQLCVVLYNVINSRVADKFSQTQTL